MSFKLEIITPDQIAYNEEIDLVIMPGIEGDFGVLRNHMPFLTYLRIGQVYIYKSKKVIETFASSHFHLDVRFQKWQYHP